MSKSRKIGLIGCLGMGIGCIIGSGVFGSLPEVINDIGGAIVWALILATVVVILRTIPAVFSTAALPTSARHFMHQTKILHPYVGVLQAFNSILITSMLALYGVLFAEYFLELFPGIGLTVTQIAIGLVILFCLLALLGNKISSNLQNCMVLTMLATYLSGYVYLFIRTGWLKRKEGYDLIARLAAPYQPWEEQERTIAAEKDGMVR